MSKMIGAHAPKSRGRSGLRYNKQRSSDATLKRDIKAGVDFFYAANKLRRRPEYRMQFSEWKTKEAR